MSLFIPASLVLLLTMTASCAGRSREESPEPSAAAMVQVENQGFTDMVVYAVDNGQRIRLGVATGHSSKTFSLPRYLVRSAGPIRFLADPIGGKRTPVSEEMTVQPGDVVTLTIPSQ